MKKWPPLFIGLILWPISYGFSTHQETATIVGAKYQQCLDDDKIALSSPSRGLIPADHLGPVAPSLDLPLPTLDWLDRFGDQTIQEMDCLILDHILVEGPDCPTSMISADRGTRLDDSLNLLRTKSALFADIYGTLSNTPAIIFFNFGGISGNLTGGDYNHSNHLIRVNEAFTCLPEAWETPVLTHELVHAYIAETLPDLTEDSSNEEILSEIMGFEMFIEAKGAKFFHPCPNVDDSSLSYVLRKNDCDKIAWLKSKKWSKFSEWVSAYSQEINREGEREVSFENAGIVISAGSDKAPADPCEAARFWLSIALEKTLDGEDPRSAFRRSVARRKACLDR
ncbi:MAG: hypothetical protein HYT79_04315 [Elusimicrobia bacterium]|nr:hypothetical protein [Elusimicrobiota bacterium]